MIVTKRLKVEKLTVSEEMNMNDEEILKVVKALTGTITPIADSNYDEKVKNNLCLLGNVVDTLVCQIGYVAVDYYDSCYASESEVGNQAIKTLNTIKSNIDSFLEEIVN